MGLKRPKYGVDSRCQVYSCAQTADLCHVSQKQEKEQLTTELTSGYLRFVCPSPL